MSPTEVIVVAVTIFSIISRKKQKSIIKAGISFFRYKRHRQMPRNMLNSAPKAAAELTLTPRLIYVFVYQKRHTNLQPIIEIANPLRFRHRLSKIGRPITRQSPAPGITLKLTYRRIQIMTLTIRRQKSNTYASKIL